MTSASILLHLKIFRHSSMLSMHLLLPMVSSFPQTKSRIFSFRNLRALPEFTVSRNVIPHCTQYLYLGAPVRITPAIPARQRVHPIVKDLDRLQQRFIPIKWFANNATGVSIPLARTLSIYYFFNQLLTTCPLPFVNFQGKP